MKMVIAFVVALGLAGVASVVQAAPCCAAWVNGLAGAAQGGAEASRGQAPSTRIIGYFFDETNDVDTGHYRICYYHVPRGIEAQTMVAELPCPARVNFPF